MLASQTVKHSFLSLSVLTLYSPYSGKFCRSENLSSGCFFCVVVLKEGNIYCSKGRTLTKAERGF